MDAGDREAGSRRERAITPIIAVLAVAYALFLVFLLLGGASGWPVWLVTLTLAPLIIGLLAYGLTAIIEFALMRRGRGSAPGPGAGPGDGPEVG